MEWLKKCQQCLTYIYITFLTQSQVICPFPKLGKRFESISGWSPIALSSCIAITFESMIKHSRPEKIDQNRVEWEMESSNRDLYSMRTVVVFLDLKSAYDNLLLPNLFECVYSLNIPLGLCATILGLLRNWEVRVLEPSTWELVSPGIANKLLFQGSPLGPLLFNLYCNFPKEITPDGCSTLVYSNDFAVIGKGRDFSATIPRINIHRISTECLDRGRRRSPGKCEAICFGNNRDVKPQDKMFVDGHMLN